MAMENAVGSCAPQRELCNLDSGFIFYGFEERRQRFVFFKHGKKFFGHGQIERVISGRQDGVVLTAKRRQTWNATDERPLSTSRFFCIGHKTGARYRFAGSLVRCKPAINIRNVLAIAKHAAPQNSLTGTGLKRNGSQSVVPVFLAPNSVNRVARRSISLPDWYVHELERIRLERAAGVDSNVRMAFLSIYLGESRANLYRKMSLVPAQFPQPVKRGRGSFWSMSVIDAYKSGELGVQHA